MDKEKYIESGILELYVLGALSEQEKLEVEEALNRYPEIRAEVAEIENAMEQYAWLHKRTLGHSLRSKVIDTINSVADQPEHKVAFVKKLEEDNRKKKRPALLSLVAIAAVVLLVFSAMFNVFLNVSLHQKEKENKQLEDEVSDLLDENTKIVETQKALYEANKTLEERVEAFNYPGNIVIHLKGTETTPEASVAVLWNVATDEVRLLLDKLPTPPEGKQYQLWSIVEGQNPQDAGVFNFGESIQTLKHVAAADMFAITLEPVGGSQTPTMPIYAIGKVPTI